jgi:anaphase-promoting complex subunit 8
MAELLMMRKKEQLISQLSNLHVGPKNAKSSYFPQFNNEAVIGRSILQTRTASVHSRFANDSIITYLYGLVLLANAQKEDMDFIIEIFMNAIKLCQYNWSAWLELARLDIPSTVELYLIEKPSKPVSLTQLKSLCRVHPKWSYINLKLATAYHDVRDFKAASEAFSQVRELDRYCIEGMDCYSNCLYVQERLPELSELAHFWMETNPNACETNIVAGNYFSLKLDHEKAAMFFKRATAIDPSNINGWLLLGHELIELRNPSAALAAYQSAAKIASPRDTRPWYAIGQLFELINQYAFAVYYHNKAIKLDRGDVRIWKALTNCYEKLGRADEARECDKKARLLVPGIGKV